jgi:general secretion pathway protein G
LLKTQQTMKNHRLSPKARAFTLIELLVVITIIVILAGLSMGGYSYVTRKQAESQAAIQISLLSKALEEYKLDNGEFPASSGGTTALYTALYLNGVNNPNTAKIYLAELDPVNNRQGWIDNSGGSVRIIDHFGSEYTYRRGDDPAAKNPDFDLASKGKDSKIGTPDDIDNY